MSVRLIAITQPVIPWCHTAEDVLAYCARVSNPSQQDQVETAPKLLSYLMRHAHWSPFEMASMTLEIITTRTVSRQIIRHRSFSFQEFSQRYAKTSAPPIISEARLQDARNRQSSLETDDFELQGWWDERQRVLAQAAVGVYQQALQRGIAKEVARNVLPEGLTESVLLMAGTIRSFIHYCAVRCDAATQKEHRQVALEVRAILNSQFPSLAKSDQEV